MVFIKYTINIDRSSEELITSIIGCFDLTTSDSIIIGSNLKVHSSPPILQKLSQKMLQELTQLRTILF